MADASALASPVESRSLAGLRTELRALRSAALGAVNGRMLVSGILRRMQAHQNKKSSMLRSLRLATRPPGAGDTP
jgi:hypothetical protein